MEDLYGIRTSVRKKIRVILGKIFAICLHIRNNDDEAKAFTTQRGTVGYASL